MEVRRPGIVLNVFRRLIAGQGSLRVAEIAASMSAADVKAMGPPCSSRGFSSRISKTLDELIALGDVECLGGKPGARRYALRLGDPSRVEALAPHSKRQWVLSLTVAAVRRIQGPVRVSDVADQADIDGWPAELTRTQISLYLYSLRKYGQLVVTSSVFGRRGGGVHFYLPAGADPNVYSNCTAPLPWANVVASAVATMWHERAQAATSLGARATPLLTREIRSWIRAHHPERPELACANRLSTTLRCLARAHHPTVRSRRHGVAGVFVWLPGNVSNEEVGSSNVFRSDTERAIAALEIATTRSGLPLASSREVLRIGKEFGELRPAGRSLASALASASRPGRVRERRDAAVIPIGHASGKSYYCLSPHLAAARSHFSLLQAETELRKIRAFDRFTSLSSCRLLPVALARAASICREVETLVACFRSISVDPNAATETRSASELHLASLLQLREALGGWERFGVSMQATQFREDTTERSATLTSSEFLQIVHFVAPQAAATRGFAKVQSLASRFLKRAPKRGGIPRARRVIRYDYDRADALMYIARTWGGSEACQQAMIARNELGDFRSPDPVVAALRAGSLDERLAAVSCLAFLQCVAALGDLRRAAEADPEPGVRNAALWAYGFAGGGDAEALLELRAADDPDAFVRNMALSALNTIREDERRWWLV
jgi:hypothetical protein